MSEQRESKPRHTPGPWIVGTINPREVRTDDQEMFPIAFCNSGVSASGAEVSEEQAQANARLIAAAPRMLARLRTMAEAYHEEVHGDQGSLSACWSAICTENRALIAEVEG